MSEYVNTVDSRGDAAICLAILNKTLDQITDTHCVTVGGYAFYKFAALHTAIFANAKNIEQYAFAYCSALTTVEIPLSKSVGYFSFYECTKLEEADFPCVTSVGRYAFNGCTALKTLILRSGTLATLSDVNALEDTPIESGKGYIYVPSALLESYKADTKWSTYTNQFRKLEDYTVDGTVTGEVDPNRCRVRFYNEDGTFLCYVMVPTGGTAVYPGDEPAKEPAYDWAFTGWSPAPTNIVADTDCYAQFGSTALMSRKLVARTLTSYEDDVVTSVRKYAFYNCSSLATADFSAVTSIEDYAFQACSSLTTVILRNTAKVATLSTASSFNDTPIKSGTGYIYVPAALIDSYKTATNWSTYANQFRAIEDYPDICGGGN